MVLRTLPREGNVAVAEHALRRLAAVTLAGGVLGLLVGGVGGRLAMMLLARLNPEMTGRSSDDNFTIGQLTLQTFNLLAVTTLIGVFGGGVYYLLRALMVGPRWFQISSVSGGAAVVVASSLVHVRGVDFTLEPVVLAIALFVAIPLVYAALLIPLAERWLAPDSRFMTASLWLALAPLLLWVPLFPFFVALLLLLVAFESVRRTAAGHKVFSHPATAWAVRVALAVLFTVSLASLVRSTVTLV
ncbi:MAG: hypothetical protein ABI873_03655 [Marmoricola sp.]